MSGPILLGKFRVEPETGDFEIVCYIDTSHDIRSENYTMLITLNVLGIHEVAWEYVGLDSCDEETVRTRVFAWLEDWEHHRQKARERLLKSLEYLDAHPNPIWPDPDDEERVYMTDD